MEKLWSKLEKEFPDWDIHHTGGGLFVLRKNYKDKKGNDVMVSVSDNMALIMKNKEDNSKYIDSREFYNNENIYWGTRAFDLEVPILKLEVDVIRSLNEADIFDKETISSISDTVVSLGEAIWA